MSTLPIGFLRALGGLTAVASIAGPAEAQAWSVQQTHANAVASFQVGRFSEAYGRFISLADAGHPASASYALWMCEHGLELFGKDWDCTGEQLQDWAQLVGAPVPPLKARHYGRSTVPPGRPFGAEPSAAGPPVLTRADVRRSRTARLKP